MGTKVHCESYFPGYYSMRDPTEGSSSSNWPLLCGDKSIGNGEYRNGYMSTTFSNSYMGGDKDAVKQKMLEHEAIFKHQVFELHRLYKTQKDLMDEMKRKELYKHRTLIETSSSSTPLFSQMHSQDAWKLKKPNVSNLNSYPVAEINSSPLSSARGNINQVDRFLSQNGCSSKDCEILESRPSKVRKKLFDLQLPDDEYTDPEDMNIGSRLEVEHNGDTYIPSSRLRNPMGLADLNEPIQVEEPTHCTRVDLSNSSHFLLGLSKDVLENPQHRNGNGILNNLHVENKGNRRDMGPYTFEGHNKTNLNFIPQPDYSLISHKPIDSTLEKLHHPSNVLESGHYTGGLFRGGERIVHGSQNLETSRDLSSLYHLKPINTFAHNLTSIQTHPLINASKTSSQTPLQHQDILSRLYSGPPPSWIKDPPPRFLAGFENMKSSKYDKVASERSINYSPSKTAKEVNLNACIEIVDVEKEHDNQIKALPWLKTETLKETDSERKIFGVPIFNKSCCTTKESSSLVSTLRDKGKSVMIDINIACDIECSTEIAEEKPLILEKSGSEKGATFQALFDLNSCVSEDEITVAPSLASTNANKPRVMIDLEVPPVPESDEDILPPEEAVLTAAQAIHAISSLVFEAPSPDPLLWFVDVVSDFENFDCIGTTNSSNEILDEFEADTLNLIEMTEEEYMPKPPLEFPKPDENTSLENGNGSGRSRGRRGAGRRGNRRRDFQRDILPGLASLSRHEVSEDIQTFASLMRATGDVWTPGLRNRARGRGRRRNVMVTGVAVANVVEAASACPSLTEGGGRKRGRSVAVDEVGVNDVAVAGVAAEDVADIVAVVGPSLTEGANIWGETPRRPRRQRGTSNSPSVNLG